MIHKDKNYSFKKIECKNFSFFKKKLFYDNFFSFLYIVYKFLIFLTFP